MKQKFLTTILFLFTLNNIYSVEDRYMVIEMKSGDHYSFLLADNPVITYEKSSLVINDNAKTSYSIEGIKEYRFSSPSDVKGIYVNAFNIVSIDDETIEVRNAKPSEFVAITAVSGAHLVDVKTDASGNATIKLPASKGVYLLCVGSRSFKIIRK